MRASCRARAAGAAGAAGGLRFQRTQAARRAADVEAAGRPGSRFSSTWLPACRSMNACPSKGSAGVYEWIFRAPDATLTDWSGRALGKHYAGPTWEAADGSRVLGEVRARDPGPDPKAIPWLLLGCQEHVRPRRVDADGEHPARGHRRRHGAERAVQCGQGQPVRARAVHGDLLLLQSALNEPASMSTLAKLFGPWVREVDGRTLRADAAGRPARRGAGAAAGDRVRHARRAAAAVRRWPPRSLPCIVAALFGSSWHVMSGPTNANSLALIAAMLAPLAVVGSADYIQLVLAVTRAGRPDAAARSARSSSARWRNFISPAALLGFTGGAAMLIARARAEGPARRRAAAPGAAPATCCAAGAAPAACNPRRSSARARSPSRRCSCACAPRSPACWPALVVGG